MHLVRHELIFKKRKKICLELVESSEGRQDPHGLYIQGVFSHVSTVSIHFPNK